jgi:hypothetical protein
MIISRAHDFGFVHIPKCAGSTIREQLRDKDDLQGRFYRTMQVEGLGKINGNHVPLRWLAEYFPADYAALRAVKSYAITRRPMDRFVSAVSQRIRAMGQEPGNLSATEIRRLTAEILADLDKAQGFPTGLYTIFMRQTDFTCHDGAQVLTELWPMENIDGFFDMLENRHGLPLIRDTVWNPTVTYRVPAMAGPLKRAKDMAKKLLPMNAYAKLRDLGIKAFTTKGAPNLNEVLLGTATITAFVADYYRADAEQHAAARAQLGQSAAVRP